MGRPDSAEYRRIRADQLIGVLRARRRHMQTERTMNSRPSPQTVKEAKERLLCGECVGVGYLHEEIDRSGAKGQCSYCGKESDIIRIGDFVGYVKKLFDDHVEEVVEGTDIKDQRDFTEIVKEQTELSLKASTDLKIVYDDMMSEKHQNESESKRCYNRNALYVYKSRDEFVNDNSWEDLQRCIREENRLFNSEARKILNEMLRDSLNLAMSKQHPEVIRVVPDDIEQNLFRARVFRSERDLAAALERPVEEFGPPPSSHAPDGRMNSRGVSVFYGATTRSCAIREVRPPVGSHVVVSCFDFARKLHLLDATEMEDIIKLESMFDPLYRDLLMKLRFLSCMSEQISAPVMRSDEPLDYLITQAVSDYLSEMQEPKLDGIMYKSTQKKDSKEKNVVLFHKSSLVKVREDQVGMKIKSEFDQEGRVTYSVTETAFDKKIENTKEADVSASDNHKVGLCLDMLKFSVHKIKGVLYEDDEEMIAQSQEGHLVGAEPEIHT